MDSDWIFFLKQKTAYEMRISDWSSDVCSSDLVHHFALLGGYGAEAIHPDLALESLGRMADPDKAAKNFIKAIGKGLNKVMSKMGISTYMRSEERRVGKECVSTCRSRWSHHP